jgi:hypothetical protein
MSTHGTPRERDDSRHGTTSVWPVVRPNVSWPATLANVASLMPHRRRQKTKEKANGRGASTRSALRTRRLAPRYHLHMACGETQCIVARDASKCRVSHAPSARTRRHHIMPLAPNAGIFPIETRPKTLATYLLLSLPLRLLRCACRGKWQKNLFGHKRHEARAHVSPASRHYAVAFDLWCRSLSHRHFCTVAVQWPN